jgi:hypothetical protein
VKENNISKAALSKIRPDLLSNYYSILSDIAPPPCQVKEQEYANNVNDITALKKFIKKGVLNGFISPSLQTALPLPASAPRLPPSSQQGAYPTKFSNYPTERKQPPPL